MKAGIIGLGAMGAPMARNLARTGYLSGVWNRTYSRAEAAARELSVICAHDPAELARLVDIMFVCVSADADVLEVMQAMQPGLNSDHVVIDVSTVSSDTARRAARMLAHSGAAFLDAPVSGGVEGARKGTLAMMVGGDETVLNRVRPLLEAITGRIVHMGEVGAGQGAKAVNQVMAAGINQAVTEALAFGQAQGLDMKKLVDVISGGAAGNWFLEHRGLTMTQGLFAPGFKLALHHKDLKICRQMMIGLGVHAELVDKTLKEYADLMEQGCGDEDISALYRLKKPQ
jgi:3-hydroxyisobutyrate dehydrogenase